MTAMHALTGVVAAATVASTGAITGLAAAAMELPGAACAAMEFEPSTGRPTFRLLPGSPGGSEALALARRMDLPAAWIARAEAPSPVWRRRTPRSSRRSRPRQRRQPHSRRWRKSWTAPTAPWSANR